MARAHKHELGLYLFWPSSSSDSSAMRNICLTVLRPAAQLYRAALNPGQDRKKRRGAVDDLVRFTKARADAGGKHSKSNKTNMGYMLYQAIRIDCKKVVDHAVQAGQLTKKHVIHKPSPLQGISLRICSVMLKICK